MVEVTPREVPGYVAARASGLLPVVPPSPPALLPGRSAGAAFTRCVLEAGVAFLLLLTVLKVMEQVPGIPQGWHVLVFLAGGTGVVGLLVRRWQQVGDSNLAELANGYTTFTMTFGAYTLLVRNRRWREGRMPWRYDACWVLDGRGRVLSPPTSTADPPGFYPSPTVAGAYELWTGCTWARQYRSVGER